jgi:hypothetical protein
MRVYSFKRKLLSRCDAWWHNESLFSAFSFLINTKSTFCSIIQWLDINHHVLIVPTIRLVLWCTAKTHHASGFAWCSVICVKIFKLFGACQINNKNQNFVASGMWWSGDMVLVEVKISKNHSLCVAHIMVFCYGVDSLIVLHRYKSLGILQKTISTVNWSNYSISHKTLLFDNNQQHDFVRPTGYTWQFKRGVRGNARSTWLQLNQLVY